MMFSRTVSPGNTRRPSGTWAMPSLTIASGPSPAIERPSKRMSPEAGFARPEMARSVVAFAGPVRAEQRDDLASLDGERDAVHGLDLAIADGERFKRDERHRARLPR